MSFWGELKRRNVYKVGVAYAIVAWLLIQAAAIIFPHLNLPSWAVTLVIVILIIGFPLALLLAWAYEVTPEGIKRTKQVPLAESITHLTGQKLNYIVTGLLVVAVAFLVFKVYFTDQRAPEQKEVSTKTEQAPAVVEVEEAPKTIAVLPFVNLSSDPEQEYFVDGLSEEILNSLAQIPDLTVIARTSSFSFKGKDKTIQEIASVLGVDNVLEGSVRKAGNALRITAQLVKAIDSSHLWSKTYERELKDIFDIQEDIAIAVASELKAALGIDHSYRQLGGTENLEAYELYLAAKGIIARASTPEEPKLALESIDAAITLDPEFALAWAAKAMVVPYLGEFDEGLKMAQKAIELEPNLMEAYVALAVSRFSKGEYIKAELAYQKAAELTATPLGLIPGYIVKLLYFGYSERALEIAEAALRSDPLNEEIRGFKIDIFGILGDLQRAEKEYERAREIYGDNPNHDMKITKARLCSGNVVSSDDIVDPNPIHVALKEHVGSPKEGLAELHRFYNDDDYQDPMSLNIIRMWASYFGDPEFVMEAMEPVGGLNDIIWYPSMKQVRQLPRFKALVKKAGLVDYWNQFGWPDMCHKLDNGDFECD